MSGYGGGRPHVESALCVSMGSLFKAGALRTCCAKTSGSWPRSRDGKKVASISYSATLSAESGELRLSCTWTPDSKPQEVACVIRFSSPPLQYGGRRWYMLCPYTQQRVRKLYKFGSIERFFYQTAIRPLLAYASHGTRGVSRPGSNVVLRLKMGAASSDLFREPHNLKQIRLLAFQRYADLAVGLAKRVCE